MALLDDESDWIAPTVVVERDPTIEPDLGRQVKAQRAARRNALTLWRLVQREMIR